MYAKPVGEIIKWLNIKYHCCADKTQVYMTLKPCDKSDDIVPGSYGLSSTQILQI